MGALRGGSVELRPDPTFRTAVSSVSDVNGLTRKPFAPALRARSMSSGRASPVSSSTGMAAKSGRDLAKSTNARPLMRGMTTSVMRARISVA